MFSRKLAHATDRDAAPRAVVRNVRHGRFEERLSVMAAVGAAVTEAEIYFEHDRASFGNTCMRVPIALGPVGAAAGVGGVKPTACAHRPTGDPDAHGRQRIPGHLRGDEIREFCA